jgi:hypothetical protein
VILSRGLNERTAHVLMIVCHLSKSLVLHIRIEIIHGSHTARVTQHSMASMNYFLNSKVEVLIIMIIYGSVHFDWPPSVKLFYPAIV